MSESELQTESAVFGTRQGLQMLLYAKQLLCMMVIVNRCDMGNTY